MQTLPLFDLLVPNLVGARRYFAMIFLFRKIIGIRAAAPPLSQKSRCAAIFGSPVILKRACSTDQEVADANPAARQHKTPQKVNLLRRFVVEVTGLEPTTSWSLTKRATKLRYTSVLPFKNSIIYYT